MKIGYIVHDLNDPSVERRCLMLERGGATVVLAGFYRGEHVNPATAARGPFVLGRSHDAAMAQRAMQTLTCLTRPKALRSFMQGCTVIMARNLEQLAIGYATAGQRPLIYECLDIHRLLVASSPPARLIQSVEGRLLKRIDLLLTSSPAFLREHFDKRPLNAATYLIENKLVVDRVPTSRPEPLAPTFPICIGWLGMLRCKKTFTVLSDLVSPPDGRIEVMISGKPSPAELPTLAEDVQSVSGMVYTGPYTYADLPDLYGQCHFAWAIDWFEEGLNSQWLLPNRLYEALAYGAVPILMQGTQMARWAEDHNVGLRVKDKDDAIHRLLNMSANELADHQARIRDIPLSDVMADDSDCRRLVSAITRARTT